MLKQADVIVIGAGVAGTSCALQLAKQGHQTILLDRQAFPRHKTCGEFMSPETCEMLNDLGVERLVQAVNPTIMDHAKIVMPHGGEITAPLPGQATGISRYELDRLLHEKAISMGVEIVTGITVTNIHKHGEHLYEVNTKQGKESVRYEARVVIGAYGTKRPQGVGSPEGYRDDTVYVGVKSHYSGLNVNSRVELYFCTGGYVGISPIENGTVNVAALLSLDSVRGSGKSVPDILRAASRTNKRLAERLAEAQSVPGTQVSIAPLRLSNIPEPWSQYPHIGDAMLMLPPLCGDGMSVALRSAWLCSGWTNKYLNEEISFDEWKQQYTDQANRTFGQLVRRARRIQNLAFARINRFYPGIVRMVPGLASYVVKATRLSEMNIATR